MKRTIVRNMKKFAAAAAIVSTCAVSSASAAITGLETLTLNTTDVDSIMGLVVIGLATLWGFRKVIKTMNRS